MAVGAYATAALAARNVPFYLAIPLSGALTALVGMVFGIPSLRLKGLYLAIATLAAHFIVAFVVVHWESMTGGVAGIKASGRPDLALVATLVGADGDRVRTRPDGLLSG